MTETGEWRQETSEVSRAARDSLKSRVSCLATCSEGCQFLAYVPGEMVAFTWNAPPHLALRAANTWVVVTFTELGNDTTAVRLVHTGFLEGPDWDDYMSYFDDAWGHVLSLLSDHWSTT